MSRSPALGWLASFLPAPVTVKWHERARSCLGALLGIAFTGGLMYLLLGPVANIPLLVAPSGAVALTAVLGAPVIHALGYRFVLEPIAIQSAALLFAALVYHAATGHRYPHAGRQDRATPSRAADEAARVGFTREDVKAVLGRRDELLDIDTNDLYSLLRETQLQAFSRSFNELRCEDVMLRHVVSVSPGTRAAATDPITELVPMFANFGHHHIPVLDRAGRVVGMIMQVDLISGLYRQTATRAREAA
ncbi:HPP family protein [Paraburkholderia sp. CI3]|uniref:HPP family protein n=1 Tax=Paraburkholderia sp. CI3 TaxID=2991060 RepID=UPI003D258086